MRQKAPTATRGLVAVSIGADNWERIFGNDKSEPLKKGERLEWDAEKREFVPAVVTRFVSSQLGVPAIHDDKLYRTKYDPGLGVGYSSRSERKAALEKCNRERASKGMPMLRERGY